MANHFRAVLNSVPTSSIEHVATPWMWSMVTSWYPDRWRSKSPLIRVTWPSQMWVQDTVLLGNFWSIASISPGTKKTPWSESDLNRIQMLPWVAGFQVAYSWIIWETYGCVQKWHFFGRQNGFWCTRIKNKDWRWKANLAGRNSITALQNCMTWFRCGGKVTYVSII